MTVKKPAQVNVPLRQRALELAASSVFSKRQNHPSNYQGSPGIFVEMTDDEAIARAKKFYAWMIGA